MAPTLRAARAAAIALPVLLLGPVGVAQAEVFTVAAPGAPGADDTCAPCKSIGGALNKVGANGLPGDEIRLGAGTYLEAVASAVEPITLTGAGREATVVSGPNNTALSLPSGSTVRDLTLRATSGSNLNPVARLFGGLIERVRIEDPSPGGAVGLIAGPSPVTLREAVVRVARQPGNRAVAGISSDLVVDASDLDGGIAITAESGWTTRVVRSVLQGGSPFGVVNNQGGSLSLTGVLVAVAGVDAVGVRTLGGATTIRGSTIAGAGADGVVALGTAAGGAAVSLTDSIVSGFTRDLVRTAADADPGPTTIAAAFSLWDPARVAESGPGAIDASGGGNLPGVDPGFASVPAGDYRLSPGSRAVDAGTPGALGADEPAVDLDSRPRLVDGDRDAVARRDLGAFELPTPSAAPAAPAPGTPAATPLGQGPAPAPSPPPAAPKAPVAKALTVTVARRAAIGSLLTVRGRAEKAGTITVTLRSAQRRLLGRITVRRLAPGPYRVLLRVPAEATPGKATIAVGLKPTRGRASGVTAPVTLEAPRR